MIIFFWQNAYEQFGPLITFTKLYKQNYRWKGDVHIWDYPSHYKPSLRLVNSIEAGLGTVRVFFKLFYQFYFSNSILEHLKNLFPWWDRNKCLSFDRCKKLKKKKKEKKQEKKRPKRCVFINWVKFWAYERRYTPFLPNVMDLKLLFCIMHDYTHIYTQAKFIFGYRRLICSRN